MPLLKSLNQFRVKLIIGLVIPVIIIFGFDFYIFTEDSRFETLLQTTPITQDRIIALEKGLQNFSQISFFFLSLVIIFNLGIVITLVVILNFSLRMILNGIKRIEGGDLSFRIPLNSQDEFGTIARFLNSATAKVEITQRSIEQKVLERTEQLAAERNKLAIVLSGISDAVLSLDLHRNIISFNKAAENLTGLAAEQVMGRSISVIMRFFDQAREISDMIYCPDNIPGFEGVLYKHNNLKIYTLTRKQASVVLTVSQIKEGMDVNLGYILTIHDVSKERELESMKLDFVSMAAHELRTPMTSIKGYLHIFLRNYKTILNPEQLNILDKINTASGRLVDLIEDLLNVARIERGTLVINPEPSELEEIVMGVVNEYAQQIKQKSLDFGIDLPSRPLPKIMADKARIAEVLNNILSNAITYTPSGGKIRIWVEVKEKELITNIGDSGPGIPREALNHLFTKFYRVAGTFGQGAKGTGLGLYICKSIIERHHGRIWAESQVGEGSIFSFSLPIVYT